jgi:flagellar hook protein FlgE
MASTTALLTGMSGINTQSRNLDIIGNNIANVSTTAFKSSRMVFSNMFSRTLSEGSVPSTNTGGTNPTQIGFGVRVGGVQKNLNNGTIGSSGDSRDLAIDGNGAFVVQRGTEVLYTRNGAFRPNSANDLVTVDGDTLLGYGVDANYNISSGALVPINIPLGTRTIAESTTEVRMSGNLDADGALPVAGSVVSMGGTAATGLRAITTAVPPPTPGNVLEGTTRLVDIEDPLLPGTDSPLFTAGQSIEIRGAEKGTRTLDTATLTIDATTTVQDYLDFMNESLGTVTTIGNNPNGSTPGATLDPLTGILSLTGNAGSVNDVRIESTDIRVLSSTGALVRSPFVAQKLGTADGESVRTTFLAYDSLGSSVEVDVAMVLDARSSNGTTWRYFVESGDASGTAIAQGTGTIDFDTSGKLITKTPINVNIDRTGTGAASPLSFTLSLENGAQALTALTDVKSQIAATYRDGAPIGTLTSYGVGSDGVITGAFTNGLTRTLGQIPLATFSNPEGLVDLGNSLLRVGPNSGPAQVKAPNSLGAGKLVGGALEQSNVDLSQEFINMILTSTGYSASSRVIRTADELMQQLLVIGR